MMDKSETVNASNSLLIQNKNRNLKEISKKDMIKIENNFPEAA